ncbi:HWE histidine kinase domain-containing protein [Methylobacterium sp. NEAU 140]|uniref:HWE histidine kinase domain-containing protein n=1 Tax=Methylobacterium sp. NEAU 140 TaxID=3064945 RepID=UPI00273760C2|nr:HWE histidine kinase domain-containing protein [Methylobacterium sp. NEAU 140]MDP4023898.1 HWE histidine kinase domain-containing protein [Methylobacterium sp. NEAU 140]
MTESADPTDRIAHLEADNARLRRLLDASGQTDGLRHGLRDTIAMLRAVLRRSATSAVDLDGYVAHLEGRLDAIGRARSTLGTFGEADLHSLVSDELLFHLVREGDRAAISGPTVRLRPRPAQTLALALHELASNAIEHGTLGEPGGRVAVAWSVAVEGAGPVVTLVWKEVGGTGLREPERRGFGREVLERTLCDDLGARTALAFEPDGLRCTLRFPLDAQRGRLVDAIAPEAGTP